MRRGARLNLVSKQSLSCCADFVPFGDNNGYLSVGQTHSKWNLDCFFYVRHDEPSPIETVLAMPRTRLFMLCTVFVLK